MITTTWGGCATRTRAWRRGQTDKSGGETWLQPRKYTTYERDANGTDEAMHRRYNRRWSKFDQPDPYDGSYDLTDPQSFNRYSYVQNDPVNFTDPSGLNAVSPGTRFGPCTPGSAVCSDQFAGGYQFLPGFTFFDWVTSYGGENRWHSGSVHVSSYRFSYGSGEEFGGSSQSEPVPQVNKDCYAFADEVARILNTMPTTKNAEVYRVLLDRFSSPTSREFGSDGFRPEFADYTGSSNQARHYAGGFAAGHFGHTAGATAANIARETDFYPGRIPGLPIPIPMPLPPTASQKADRALNYAAARHGGLMRDRKISPRQLAGMIRKDICAPFPK